MSLRLLRLPSLSLSRVFAGGVSLVVGSLLVGCGHTETHVAMLRAPEPTTSSVELYIAGQAPPTRPFFDIAVVQAVGFGSEANPESIAHALTEKAAALGCDAVVRAFIDVGYSRAHAAGVCVKFLAPGPAGPAPVLPRGRSGDEPPKTTPAPSPKIEPLPSSPNLGR